MRRKAGSLESPFATPVAVEVWDAWFRWRRDGKLRDDTVEATWQRVAASLSSIEASDERRTFERRLLDALADWRLLPDERILATAGTGTTAWPDDGLVATLNVARFVRAAGTSQATIDTDALKDGAALAVRMLDNAIVLSAGETALARDLRIGPIGLADALASLGLDYGSAQARDQAQRVARAIAEGCLGASVELASMRGAAHRCDAHWLARAHAQAMPVDLIARARNGGLRHRGLTCVTSQPRLARFANNVADAIDPPAEAVPHHAAQATTHTAASVVRQLEMRSAMQPWVDEPIAYAVKSAVHQR